MRALIYPSQNKYFDRFMAILKQINIERYNYAKTFVQTRDQYNVCVGYLMLCVLCNRVVGSIKRKANNKPYIDDVNISISHSDNMIAVVVSDYNVGIDCERIGNISNEVVKYTFSNTEKSCFNTDLSKAKIWTAKEALSKFLNEDFYSTPVTKFEIIDDKIVERNHQYLQFLMKEIKDNVVTICCNKEENVTFMKCDADYILKQINNLFSR